MLPRAGQLMRCARLSWQLAVGVLLAGPACGTEDVFGKARVGFCLDRMIDGTNFARPSSVESEEECNASNHLWCPLRNITRNVTDKDGGELEYYWLSPCCVGTQGRNLVPDDRGLPTCRQGSPAETCARGQWTAKLTNDLLGTDSNYDIKVAPHSTKQPIYALSGTDDDGSVPCACKPGGSCEKHNDDNTTCLRCASDVSCGGDVVELGIYFYKMHSVDLKTTQLSVSAWVRQFWHDNRLGFDQQCYGGTKYMEVQAEAGSLENSVIWTPDIELYNCEETIWQGSLSARMARLESCSDGHPVNSSDCGKIFWSRPGVVKALCRYKGLFNFPWDDLSCELKFGAWAVDGLHQDVQPFMRDGGNLFEPQDLSFQDYLIENISVRRVVEVYDFFGNAPWPNLIYTIKFSRSESYYVVKLVVPAIAIAILSFLPFWMDPGCGERLGYGITVIVAMLALDITAATLMPVCNERLLIDYITLGCQAFCLASLLETAAVLYIHQQRAEFFYQAFMPDAWRIASRWVCSGQPVAKKGTHTPKSPASGGDHAYRRSLYHQLFDIMDSNSDGYISVRRATEFLQYLLGRRWRCEEADEWLQHRHQGNRILYLRFGAFMQLCESIMTEGVTQHFPAMAQDYIKHKAHLEERLAIRWADRAKAVDVTARAAFPLAFAFWITTLVQWSINGKLMETIYMEGNVRQVLLLLYWLVAVMVCFVIYGLYLCISKRRQMNLGLCSGDALDSEDEEEDDEEEDPGETTLNAAPNGSIISRRKQPLLDDVSSSEQQ